MELTVLSAVYSELYIYVAMGKDFKMEAGPPLSAYIMCMECHEKAKISSPSRVADEKWKRDNNHVHITFHLISLMAE